MGSIAVEILKKHHGYEQRLDAKSEADKAEQKLMGDKSKGSKEADTLDKKDAEGKKVEKDKRDLGDSSADAKKAPEVK